MSFSALFFILIFCVENKCELQ